MRRVEQWSAAEDEQAGANRQTSSLAALAVVLAIVIVSLFLVRELRSQGAVDDCMMSGRSNCALIQDSLEHDRF